MAVQKELISFLSLPSYLKEWMTIVARTSRYWYVSVKLGRILNLDGLVGH